MTKKYRVLITSLVLIALVLGMAACKTTRRKVDEPPKEAVTETGPPPIPTTTTQEQVPEPTDFVTKEPEVVTDVLPADIEQLQKYLTDRGLIRDAFFNYDEATLDDAAQSALTTSANWLKSADGRGYGVLIEGHCDERGTEQYNLALGDRRANAAKDYLTTLGVEAGRIKTVSYGEERPFEEGSSESAWAQNRRAHIVLVR
jgi:peptidoglycan-associated lipoprotein